MIKRYKFIQIMVLGLLGFANSNPIFAAPENQSGNVGIDAYIPCTVNLTSRPEKRVLSPNPSTKESNPNRQTNILLYIYEGSERVTEFTGDSNSAGQVSFDPCNPGYTYPADALGNRTYTIYVKGLSHLRSSYTKNLTISNFSTTINLLNDNSDSSLATRTALYNSFSNISEYEAYSQDLYAGEISSVFDNMINALDFSVLSSLYGSNNNKTDLNQDSIVNSLDFSILSTNYWKGGALIPGEVWSNAAQNFLSARQNVISNQ